MKTRRILPTVLLLAGLGATALADWGGDLNPGEGPKMVAEVQGDLLKIVQAPEAERAERVASFLQRGGKFTIEALKRFRNPELVALFFALLDHPDWHLQHRGLFALEYVGDASKVVDRAWLFLQHPERRMREKAAITCIKRWDGRKPADDIDALIANERDFHVRRCFEALRDRIGNRLVVEKVCDEHVVTLENGLQLTPFLSGMQEAKKVAPTYVAKIVAREGKGSASRLDAADRWTTPILGYGEEEVPGTSLQPFANLRQDGTVYHVGQDMGACLDGAGLYAPAAGVVKLIHTGSDMGTLIVVEHPLPGGRLVNGVMMHGGDTVFVAAGDLVRCGQILGTMGLGFSIENGGHFAHLHYGLYPGPFDMRHNYGYKPVDAGLADWLDPAEFLPNWIERTKPVVVDLFPPSPALASAVAKANDGDYGRAHAEALRLRERSERRSKAWADADEVVQALKGAPRRGVGRGESLVEGGYPREAVAWLEKLRKACDGMDETEILEKALAGYKDDEDFQLALKGEPKVEAAEKKALKERDPAKTRKAFHKLLDTYGSTCLRERIEETLRRLEDAR